MAEIQLINELTETDRLFLKPTCKLKAKELSDFHIRNREFLKKFIPTHDEAFFTEKYWEETLQADLEDEKKDRSYHFYIYCKECPDELIGYIGVNGIIRRAFQSCFIGYQMDKAWVNNGYMTEAVGKVTEIAFGRLGLHRIEANIMPWNTRSLRVVQKNGFVNEGIARDYLLINGKWEDHIHMVKLNPEWKQLI